MNESSGWRLKAIEALLKLVKPALWYKYDLDIYYSRVYMPTVEEQTEGIRRHNLVAGYLEAHPEIAEEYRTDQSGKVKYYDVLALAEGRR